MYETESSYSYGNAAEMILLRMDGSEAAFISAAPFSPAPSRTFYILASLAALSACQLFKERSRRKRNQHPTRKFGNVCVLCFCWGGFYVFSMAGENFVEIKKGEMCI